MRWPWIKKRPRPSSEATEARVRAEQDLAESRERRAQVNELMERLRAERRRNHFAASIEHIFREGRA